ncbi:MAG TPA: transcriptional repressor [Anaerolineae bacterium]|nr:transcriptional repressor [Anaerolineae bacterium]
MQSVDALIELFRQRGLKVTPQRRVIFETLVGDNSHPTAEQVYRRLQVVMPEISRTTVYNTLHELVDMGELTPVEDLSESGARYDTNITPHHHLFCTRCRTLTDIHHDFGIELPPEERAGYQIIRSQITFYGICPKCLT